MQYSIPKGVFDILPLPQESKLEDQWRHSHYWYYVESILRQTALDYGFKEIRTPVFEKKELFVRGVGEGSDIVSKEMYIFDDKGGRTLALRPEGTAPVIRAFVENHLDQQATLHKFFYIAPMFRYERPQSGRYRQHHQFGVEAIGIGKPEQDVEMIDMLYEIYRRLGLKDLVVIINSLGDEESQSQFKEALTTYLQPHFNQLSSDSQTRFSKNVLRILDSKDIEDQKILAQAPSLLEMLNESCKAHFSKVCSLLKQLSIPFEINPKLVRGLDYYNKTVFEVISKDLGAQNSIGGGGRYDGLIHSFGGPNLPSIGFATGIERILQTMIKQNITFPSSPSPFIFMIPLGEEGQNFCFNLLCLLRHAKIPAEIDLSGKKIQQGLQLANQLNAQYTLIIGEEEMKTERVKLKKMDTRETFEVKCSELLEQIKKIFTESN